MYPRQNSVSWDILRIYPSCDNPGIILVSWDNPGLSSSASLSGAGHGPGSGSDPGSPIQLELEARQAGGHQAKPEGHSKQGVQYSSCSKQ